MDSVSKIKDAITIPEYYTQYIDKNIDLSSTPKICCPFHKEDTPSFSYSMDKRLWRCWGACKVGGDVIALHQKRLGLRRRQEAIDDLVKILGIQEVVSFVKLEPKVNMKQVKYSIQYSEAVRKASSKQDYLDLDYLLSQHLDLQTLTDLLEEYNLRF